MARTLQHPHGGEEPGVALQPRGDGDHPPPVGGITGHEGQDARSPVPRTRGFGGERTEVLTGLRVVMGPGAVDPAVRDVTLTQIRVEGEEHEGRERAGQRVDRHDGPRTREGARQTRPMVTPPEAGPERRALRPELEVGGVVDHPVAGQEEHRDHGRDGVQVARSHRREGDHRRHAEGPSGVVGRTGADGEGLQPRQDPVLAEPLQDPRPAEGGGQGRRQGRGQDTDEHGPFGERQLAHDRRGALRQDGGGSATGEQDEHAQVDDRGQPDRGERAPGDRPARGAEIPGHGHALTEAGDRREEDREGLPEPDGGIRPGQVVGEPATVEVAHRAEEERDQRHEQQHHHEVLEAGGEIRTDEPDRGEQEHEARGDELDQGCAVTIERDDQCLGETDRVERDRHGDRQVQHEADRAAELDAEGA